MGYMLGLRLVSGVNCGGGTINMFSLEIFSPLLLFALYMFFLTACLRNLNIFFLLLLQYNNTPLHVSALNGHASVAAELVAAGAGLSATDDVRVCVDYD